MHPRVLALAALLALPTLAICQASDADSTKPPLTPQERRLLPQETRTFFLKNSDENHQVNEVFTAIRNTLEPSTKIYLLPSENTIVITGNQDQIDLTARLIETLDRPRKSYRLTYTVTTLDNNQRVGTEHFSMIVVSGQHAILKQGSKIPLATGSYKPDSGATETQYTYLDIGMNFDATLTEFAAGVRLQSKIEQSAVAPEQSPVGASDPVIRQSVLEGTSILTPGKPLLLGSFDVAGSTRHIDITVTMEPAT